MGAGRGRRRLELARVSWGSWSQVYLFAKGGEEVTRNPPESRNARPGSSLPAQ